MTDARKVFIGLPTLDGTFRVPMVQALLSEIQQSPLFNTAIHVEFWDGCSLLPNTRNGLVSKFLEDRCAEFTDFVFIDSDMAWLPGSLQKLLAHPVDFVGATYRVKQEEEKYWVDKLDEPRSLDRNGLVEVKRLPAGFFRMTRAGLKRVVEKTQPMRYSIPTMPDLVVYALYQLKFEDNIMYGEDYVFCDLVRSAGEKVYLDPMLNLSHVGSKAYEGNFAAFCAEKNRPKLPAEEEAAHNAKLIKFAQAFATPEMDRLLRQATGQAL